MAGINNISNLTHDPNHVNKQNEIKKTSAEAKPKKTTASATVSRESDQAQISQAARELLRLETEARKYVDQVKSSQTFSEKELDELLRKIQDKTYFSPEIID